MKHHPRTVFRGEHPFPPDILESRLAEMARRYESGIPMWDRPLPGDGYQPRYEAEFDEDDWCQLPEEFGRSMPAGENRIMSEDSGSSAAS